MSIKILTLQTTGDLLFGGSVKNKLLNPAPINAAKLSALSLDRILKWKKLIV
jgi:hypothetical protein